MIIDALYLLIGALEQTISIILGSIANLLPTAVTTGLDNIASSINNLIGYIWLFDGFIRIQTLINILVFIASIWIFKYIYNIALAIFGSTPILKFKNPKVSLEKDDK